MTISVKAYANADDVLIAWQPDSWSSSWVGFQLERRNDTTQQVTIIANRIPPQPGQGPVQPTGISSAQSPIRRCIWTDHGAVAPDSVSYRVTAMTAAGNGAFTPDASSASAWTAPVVASGDAGGGLEAYFNRGTLMSQIVSRFVNGDVSDKSLRDFLTNLKTPGFQARLYLAGDALHEILRFLHDADRRGSSIHAAIYEMNDRELVEALKPFGSRGHVLLGNGSATRALGRSGACRGRARSAASRSVASWPIIAKRAQQVRCRKRCDGQRQSCADRQYQLDDDRPLHTIEQRADR